MGAPFLPSTAEPDSGHASSKPAEKQGQVLLLALSKLLQPASTSTDLKVER